ncbi:MAG: ABC transporter ATP-binding protein [Desulfotomaculales bacterium]
MLSVRELHVWRGPVHVLQGLSLDLPEGEITVLLGPNGAGKSTLLGALAGLYRPRAGGIYYRGADLAGRPAAEIVRLGITLVPEGRQIFPVLSVYDNLVLGAYHRLRRDGRRWRQDLERVLELFPALAGRLRDPAGSLSGGLQQMLAIGRGLMADPRVLLLDEPSVGLAPLVVREIMNVIAHLKTEGRTILLVEQNARATMAVADRVWLMQRGRIIGAHGEGEPEEESLRQAYLGHHPAGLPS